MHGFARLTHWPRRAYRARGLAIGLLTAALAVATPRHAGAVFPGEVPTHSRLLKQNCIGLKDFSIIKLGGYYHVYSIRVDHAFEDLPGSGNSNVFVHERSAGNLQKWELYPNEPLENPARTGWDDDHIWAPHLVDRNGLIHMFYTGVEDIGSLQYQRMGVRTATNLNLFSSPWNPNGTDPTTPVFECGTGMPWNCSLGDFRDPFVMRNPNANDWLMYYAAKRSTGQMGIGVGISGSDAVGNPLVGSWTNGGDLVDNVAKYGGFKVESPHFFQHGDTRYMLFTGDCVTGEPCDGGNAIHVLTTTDPTLAPSSWVNRGTLNAMLGGNNSLWFASEYVKDPDTGEEFLGVFRQSQLNADCRGDAVAESDSGTIEFRRILWDVDGANPWKFALADPNPPGFWLLQSTSGPSARDRVGAAIDTKRHRVMLFGGADATAKNDYWTLTLSLTPSWSNWSPYGTAPSVRNRPGVVYDPLGDRMLVFGGFSGYGVGTALTDCYQLTGLSTSPTWSTITASGGPSMLTFGTESVFDPVRNRLIVVDGIGRTWALSLPSGGAPTWATLQNSGGLTTAGALFFNLVYDSKRDRLLAFGGWLAVGNPSNNSLNGVQAFPLSGPNANTWQTITVSGAPPSQRSLSAAIYDPVRDRLIVHGGAMPGDGSGAFYGDDWQLAFGANANTGTWTQLSAPTSTPSARGGHTAVYDPIEDRMLTLLGRTGSATYSSQTWSRSWGAGAPWQVTDLTWNVHCTSIDFSWTAPRDDKPKASDDPSDGLPINGNASIFELRRNSSAVTDANWYSSELVATGTSATAGTTQTVNVGEPTCLTQRYYAVRTRDEAGHDGATSNSTWQTKCYGSGGPPYCWDESVPSVLVPIRMALDVQGAHPARGSVRIGYAIPGGAEGRSFDVSVYDVAGRQLAQLVAGHAAPGAHELTWAPATSGHRGAAGVYFVRFRLGDERMTRTVVVQ